LSMNPTNTKKYSSGVTLIELAIVVVILSMAGLGLVSSMVTIIDFYTDDLVAKDIRHYGNAVLNDIADSLEIAETVSITTDPNGWPLITYTKSNKPNVAYTIQSTERNGFLWQARPMFEKRPLQVLGIGRENGQRDIFLFDYDVQNMYDIHYASVFGGRNLEAVAKSVFEIKIIYGLTTRHKSGEELTEYFTFSRKVYAPQSLVYKKTQSSVAASVTTP